MRIGLEDIPEDDESVIDLIKVEFLLQNAHTYLFFTPIFVLRSSLRSSQVLSLV